MSTTIDKLYETIKMLDESSVALIHKEDWKVQVEVEKAKALVQVVINALTVESEICNTNIDTQS
jgi:hypothetical protein